jgi:hypothetical protein
VQGAIAAVTLQLPQAGLANAALALRAVQVNPPVANFSCAILPPFPTTDPPHTIKRLLTCQLQHGAHCTASNDTCTICCWLQHHTCCLEPGLAAVRDGACTHQGHLNNVLQKGLTAAAEAAMAVAVAAGAGKGHQNGALDLLAL